jgi:hypothetical protein
VDDDDATGGHAVRFEIATDTRRHGDEPRREFRGQTIAREPHARDEGRELRAVHPGVHVVDRRDHRHPNRASEGPADPVRARELRVNDVRPPAPAKLDETRDGGDVPPPTHPDGMRGHGRPAFTPEGGAHAA